jgi:hypothetical protein
MAIDEMMPTRARRLLDVMEDTDSEDDAPVSAGAVRVVARAYLAAEERARAAEASLAASFGLTHDVLSAALAEAEERGARWGLQAAVDLCCADDDGGNGRVWAYRALLRDAAAVCRRAREAGEPRAVVEGGDW